MGNWRPHGRASVSASNPRALGVCDRCGFFYNHDQLRWQFQWGGNTLFNTRLLVCQRCLDVPQQQLRSISLPPDPTPILNARPEQFAVDVTPWLVTQSRSILTTQSGLRLITQAVNPDS